MAGLKRRRRIPDKYNVGKSSIVPFVESESWNERHARRKNDAVKHKETVRSWCNNHHWDFWINNNGHHWIFVTHEKKRIEWFPSSGKLVIGQNWRNGVHCHDYKQLIEILEATL